MVIFLYGFLLLSLAIYSYALVDPNLTLISHPLWAQFREVAVDFGYYQRENSAIVFTAVIILLFLFHYYFVKHASKVSIYKILFLISGILLFSYPFLSRDFFNYMFDARIITVYHQNPYFHKALDYPADSWLRFMHWTHRTYPYGPVWLTLTVIPSFFSLGKFLLSFVFFKTIFVVFYAASVLYLNKLNTKWAIFFATNPLILIEGLTNAHNDFIAVGFAIIGIFYLVANKKMVPFSLGKWLNGKKLYYFSLLHLLFSVGVKYITIPLVLLSLKKESRRNLIAAAGVIGIVTYISLHNEIQPWYFLNFFALLPFYYVFIQKWNILFAGLLFSYYPYIRFGDWTNPKNVALKHTIIAVFFVLNVLILVYEHLKYHKKLTDYLK